MKLTIDQKKCIGCGSCAAICPEYFRMNSKGKSELIKKDAKEISKELKDAADSCPVQCIKIEK